VRGGRPPLRAGRNGRGASLGLWSTLEEALVLVQGIGTKLAASPGLLARSRRVPSILWGRCVRVRSDLPSSGVSK
jgi:hypothetical protein